MTLPYRLVDVFTDVAYGGNPLAVVLDAEHLPTSTMQAIAREFNLSETAFPLPPTQCDADYRLRIFTPSVELPFAGHPSVGAAWVLASLGRVPVLGTLVQECGAGLLPIRLDVTGAELTGAAPVVGAELDPAPLLAAVGLDTADLVGPPPRIAGTGITFGYLLVHHEAVVRAAPNAGALCALSLGSGLCVTNWTDGAAHSRVFAAAVGVLEDPATGSAALGLSAYLTSLGLLPGEGETSYVVSQGAEMGRPSVLSCTVVASGGQAVRCRVAGSVVLVAHGELVAEP